MAMNGTTAAPKNANNSNSTGGQTCASGGDSTGIDLYQFLGAGAGFFFRPCGIRRWKQKRQRRRMMGKEGKDWWFRVSLFLGGGPWVWWGGPSFV